MSTYNTVHHVNLLGDDDLPILVANNDIPENIDDEISIRNYDDFDIGQSCRIGNGSQEFMIKPYPGDQDSQSAGAFINGSQNIDPPFQEEFEIRNGEWCDYSLYNVIILGLSFMFICTGYQTCTMVEETVIQNENIETNGTFKGSGYIALALLNTCYGISIWFMPLLISSIGSKLSMIGGGIIYCLFTISFLWPNIFVLYFVSALAGIGGTAVWVSQGNYLANISNCETINRNCGTFWVLYQLCLIIGNIYAFYIFHDESSISIDMRYELFWGLVASCALGVFTLCFLQKPIDVSPLLQQQDCNQNIGTVFIKEIMKSVNLFKDYTIILLCPTFFYTGLELSYFTGIFGTCIGNTGRLINAKDKLALSGIGIGIGEILGGFVLTIFGHLVHKFGRDSVIICGFIMHLTAFYLSFLNLPDDSPFYLSYEITYIKPNFVLLMLCAVLLGMGDCCYNTQLIATLSIAYKGEFSANSFCLFNFIQCIGIVSAFFIGNYLLLKWQLLLMVIFCTVGSCTFCVAQRRLLYNGQNTV